MGATQATSDVVRGMAAAMEENRRYLTKLDSEIGDGDHGNNMNRGFQAALDSLEGADPSTPADVLKAVSMALISKVGGAAGPLYGTAFLRASSALGAKEEISAEDAAEALEAALGGVKQRGKAEVGDKTIVDALEPPSKPRRSLPAEGAWPGCSGARLMPQRKGPSRRSRSRRREEGRAIWGQGQRGIRIRGRPLRICSLMPRRGRWKVFPDGRDRARLAQQGDRRRYG